MKGGKLIIRHFNNMAQHYRRRLTESLMTNEELEYHYYYGDEQSQGIRQIDFNEKVFQSYSDQIHPIKNIWFRKYYLIWQSKILKTSITGAFDFIILTGEIQIIVNWFATLISRIRGKQTIFWGHGLYGNEGWLKLFVRLLFYRMADKHLVYERRAKSLMVAKGISAEKIHVIFNSLEYDIHKELRGGLNDLRRATEMSFFNNPEKDTWIFIGRLTAIKKLHILLEAAYILRKKGVPVNVLLVGDGDQKEALSKIASELELQDQVHFYGPCYQEDVLYKLIATSDLCVSPGNVGLTGIHALSFGTPVATHNNFNYQMPEVEAIEDNVTGFFFEQDNSRSLAYKYLEWRKTNSDRAALREKCFKIIDTYYNPYYQEKVVLNLLKGGNPLV